MRPRSRCVNIAVTLSMIMACVSGAVGQPSNDNCSTPLPISGSGTFQFDFSQAAMDIPFISNCGAGGIDLSRDLWYCWTADCTGLVTITTCGQTTINTAIAIFPGCACPPAPGQPLCCNDDGPTNCAPQSEVRCEVVCGQQYMIQLGEREFSGLPGGSGTFSISCEGTPCDDHGCPPGVCCGNTPRFAGTAGPVSVSTTFPGNPNLPVVQVVDLANDNTAPLGSWWNTAPFYASPTSWNLSNLGSIFGVALDRRGNIYVAHSSVYASSFVFMPTADTLGFGGAGAIYKIDTTTAAVSLLVSLPNVQDPAIVAAGFPTEAYPGIGNITVNCDTGNLYASNFEDGRIYRIPLSGSPAGGSTFDHASNTVSSGIAPESTDTPGFVRLGERVWAVETHQGRLYYSVYSQDTFRSVGPNTVWSVQLDATGNFVPNTRRQEMLSAVQGCINPYSDIAFSPSGSMFLAQRSMGDPNATLADTRSWAHESCLLEFVCDPAAEGSWAPSANSFDLGFTNPDTVGPSAAGGVDVDYRPGGRVWASADAIIAIPPTWLYGLQGIPAGGNVDPSSSILIDLDNDVTFHDKTSIGSVEVSCPTDCLEFAPGEILCRPREPGSWIQCYDYTFTITNLSGQSVEYVLIPNSLVTPNVIGPFAPGTFDHGDSQTITVQICSIPNTTVVLPVILMNNEFQECCHREISVDLPECDCFQLVDGPTVTNLGNGQYSLSFTFQPLDFNVGHVFFDYEPGIPPYNVTVTPTYVPVTVPQFGTQTFTATITVTGAGTDPIELCFRMFIHTPDLLICCSELICVTVNGGGSTGCQGDLNGDGVVDLSDLALLLSAYGTSNTAGDVDGDGDVDLTDLSILLSHFGTPC